MLLFLAHHVDEGSLKLVAIFIPIAILVPLVLVTFALIVICKLCKAAIFPRKMGSKTKIIESSTSYSDSEAYSLTEMNVTLHEESFEINFNKLIPLNRGKTHD